MTSPTDTPNRKPYDALSFIAAMVRLSIPESKPCPGDVLVFFTALVLIALLAMEKI